MKCVDFYAGCEYTARAEGAEKKLAAAEGEIKSQISEIARISGDLAALQALKEEMESKIVKISGKLEESETTVIKEKKISEDQLKDAEDNIQKLTNEHISKIDEILEHKEKEIMEV